MTTEPKDVRRRKRASTATTDRLLSRVEMDPNGGCWLWARGINAGGYGHYFPKGERNAQKAHRASYEAFVGPVPAGLNVLHRCDVRCCINPGHLFVGSDRMNARDRSLKGRSASKLSIDQVREIYGTRGPAQAVADCYGVTLATIHRIWNGTRWKNITGHTRARSSLSAGASQ